MRKETGIDAIGCDTSHAARLDQGRLAGRIFRCRAISIRCCSSPAATSFDARVGAILATLGQGPFIFNLGHGILPETPIAHVERLLNLVKRRSS